MNREISIRVGGKKYKILGTKCDKERLEKAVQRLSNEQSHAKQLNKYDEYRATVMIAINSFYEYDELHEKYEKLLIKEKELEALSKEFEELSRKERKLQELCVQYRELELKHSEFEEEVNSAIIDAQKLSQEISIQIA